MNFTKTALAWLAWRYMARTRFFRKSLKATARALSDQMTLYDNTLQESADVMAELRQELHQEQVERRRFEEHLDVAKTVNELLAAGIEADIERERTRAVVYATKRTSIVPRDKGLLD